MNCSLVISQVKEVHMKRFSIIMTETGRDDFNLDEFIILKKENYNGLISIAQRINEWGYVASNIPILCDKCGSFIIDVRVF